MALPLTLAGYLLLLFSRLSVFLFSWVLIYWFEQRLECLEFNFSKIRDLEEELKIVGNALKSLEASDASVSFSGAMENAQPTHFTDPLSYTLSASRRSPGTFFCSCLVLIFCLNVFLQ